MLYGEGIIHTRQTLGIIHIPTPDSRVSCLHRIEDIRCNQSEEKNNLVWKEVVLYFSKFKSFDITLWENICNQDTYSSTFALLHHHQQQQQKILGCLLAVMQVIYFCLLLP